MKSILLVAMLLSIVVTAGCGSSAGPAGARDEGPAPAPASAGGITPEHQGNSSVAADAPTMVPAPPASASGSEPPPATPAAAPAGQALAERGLQVYQAQYCGLCHQLDAAGTKGLFGPTHNGMAGTAEQRLGDPQYTGAARTAAEYIRESILEPNVYLVEGYEHTQYHMPTYRHLDPDDVEAMVQMLIEQK